MENSTKPQFGLFLAFNNERIDGVGAQFLRKLFAYRLAKKYELGYWDVPLKEFHVHPSDGVENVEDYEVLKLKLNLMFRFPTDANLQKNPVIIRETKLPKVLRKVLYKYRIPLFLCANTLLLRLRKTVVVYIDDLSYELQKKLTKFRAESEKELRIYPEKSSMPRKTSWMKIVVHIRRGDITLNQNIDNHQVRFIKLQEYENILSKLVRELDDKKIDFKIDILTDASIHNYKYRPLQSQKSYWRDLGVLVNDDYVEIPESNLKSLSLLDPRIEVLRNLDIVETFQRFLDADALVISKSSFSYLAALLRNHGVTFYFPFWHPSPPEWRTVDNIDFGTEQ